MPDGSQRTMLCGEDVEDEIRRLNVSNNVSQVSVIPLCVTVLSPCSRLSVKARE